MKTAAEKKQERDAYLEEAKQMLRDGLPARIDASLFSDEEKESLRQRLAAAESDGDFSAISTHLNSGTLANVQPSAVEGNEPQAELLGDSTYVSYALPLGVVLVSPEQVSTDTQTLADTQPIDPAVLREAIRGTDEALETPETLGATEVPGTLTEASEASEASEEQSDEP